MDESTTSNNSTNETTPTLSIAPPILDEENTDESISEHISTENDRSIPEIEFYPNFTQNTLNLTTEENDEQFDSIISLNGLEQFTKHQSIMEEILNENKTVMDDHDDDDDKSLNIFANVKFDAPTDYGLSPKQTKNYEELLAVKNETIATLNAEVDSLKGIISDTSSSTEYRHYQDEHQTRLIDYHTALVHKDELIQKLTKSLEESLEHRDQLKIQSHELQSQIKELQEQLRITSDMLRKNPINFDVICDKFSEQLNEQQRIGFDDIKCVLNQHTQQQMNDLMRKFEMQMTEKHSNEMEELRRYFEKKCVDLEKNYSEEIFSQQSRKMSGSSMDSSTTLDLPSDFIFTNHPGPNGDGVKIEFNTKDLGKLMDELRSLMDFLGKYDLKTMNEHQLDVVKNEILKRDLKNLLKIDLLLLRNELRNKYHAELEILREDYENRLDLVNLENEKKLKCLQEQHDEEMVDLQKRLNAIVPYNRDIPVQEVANSGDFEINEVVKSYEYRLQEQVSIAKLDIIAALENQIQILASNENIVDDEWPSELIKLRDRFKEKYEEIIKDLQKIHDNDIKELKEKYETHKQTETNYDEIMKNRDTLKRQNQSLRHLLSELYTYFTRCEDELNTTLIDEFAKLDTNDNSTIGRVQLIPNLNEILDLIDNSTNDELDMSNVSLQQELTVCLDKLRKEANTILTLTNELPKKLDENNMNELRKRLMKEEELRKQLSEQLNEKEKLIKLLETDLEQFEEFVSKQNLLQKQLDEAREKIAELIENGHREIVSQGYGVSGVSDQAVGTLSELQEKVRILLGEDRKNHTNIDQQLLELIEEFSRTGETIKEESLKDREDFIQQISAVFCRSLKIEAADKKYKKIVQFLEEQTNEREEERVEAQKEIDRLKDILKERDKERANCESIAMEIERLEQHVRELNEQLSNSEEQRRLTEIEQKEAVEKIYDLRDIIRDLEQRIESKTTQINDLQTYIDELEQELLNVKKLNEEYKHAEIINLPDTNANDDGGGGDGESTLKLIKNHLNEFETTIDRKTKDLEGLHATHTNCSNSPSEEMSIRDVVNAVINDGQQNDCDLPLRQLERLKEKLVRHSRAEEIALKRIKDLEMEICVLKNEIDENGNEKDVLKKLLSDQLVLISSLQIRLDDQRMRAEHIEKQTNTSLEVKIYDLQNVMDELQQECGRKERTIERLNRLIEELKEKLKICDKEIQNGNENDKSIIINLQKDYEELQHENMRLNKQILEQKSTDKFILKQQQQEMQDLKQQLTTTQHHLDLYTSLDVDNEQLDAIKALKKSGISFVDLLSDGPEVGRRLPNCSDNLSMPISTIFHKDESTMTQDPEISNISIFEDEKPIKHVHFEMDENPQNQQELEKELDEIRFKLEDFKKLEKSLRDELHEINEKFAENSKKTSILENESKRKDEMYLELAKEKRELEKKLEKLEELELRVPTLDKQIFELNKQLNLLEIKHKDMLLDRDCEIEILNEDNKKYQDDILKLEQDLKNSENHPEIQKLRDELNHVQDLLNEKEKIIEQITEDSKCLHVNLETIKKKMNETGNVIDLARRLRDEKARNASINHDLNLLRIELKQHGNDSEKIGDLERQLQDLKSTLEQVKLDDALLIDKMRVKLDNALDFEEECSKMIDNERKRRECLEQELEQLKHTRSPGIDFQELHMKNIPENNLQENSEISIELCRLKAKLQVIDGQKKRALDELNMKKNDIRHLDKKIIGLEMDLQKTRSEKKYLRKLSEDYKQKSELKETRIMDMEKSYKALQRLYEQNYQTQSNNPLPQLLDEKIQDLHHVARDDIRQMTELIQRLLDEKRELENRIAQMQDEKQAEMNFPKFNDAFTRSDYLFARFLREESYRKALVWQKRYLIYLLKTYQMEDDHTLVATPNRNIIKLSGKSKFRSIVAVIISVHRMKTLIRRWSSGKRQIHAVNMPYFEDTKEIGERTRITLTKTCTPPTKDLSRIPAQDLPRLSAPKILTECIERFNQINERLGIVSDNVNSNG